MTNNANNPPEQALPQNEPCVCAVRCCACGACIEVCQRGVLAAGEHGPYVAYPELCDACLACEQAFPEGAIEVSFAIVWAEPLPDASDQA